MNDGVMSCVWEREKKSETSVKDFKDCVQEKNKVVNLIKKPHGCRFLDRD